MKRIEFTSSAGAFSLMAAIRVIVKHNSRYSRTWLKVEQIDQASSKPALKLLESQGALNPSPLTTSRTTSCTSLDI